MLRVRGRMQGGRLVIDERLDLPEGAEVDVLVADGDEDWPPELDDVLAARMAEAARGEVHSAEDVLTRLRGR